MIEACKVLGIRRLEKESLAMLLNLAVKRRDDWRRAEKNLPVLYARALEIAREKATEHIDYSNGRML